DQRPRDAEGDGDLLDPATKDLADILAHRLRLDPGDQAALAARYRQALQLGVGDGQRLNQHLLGARLQHGVLGSADQGGAEGQDVGADVRLALGEQQYGAAVGEAAAHLAAAAVGIAAARAVDKEGALQGGHEADEEPVPDLLLGDEGDGDGGADGDDVGPGNVVGNNENGALIDRPANDVDVEAEKGGTEAVEDQ